MNTNFIFSKRIFYATIFSVVVIGGALYFSQNKSEQQIEKDNTRTSAPKSSADSLTSEQETIAPKSSADSITSEQVTIAPKPELTETDILTRNVLKPYIEQNNTDTYSPENGKRIIAKATKEMFKLDYTPIEPKDITTKQDSTKQAIIQYKKDLYKAIKPIFAVKEYELTTYARAIRDNDKEGFDLLAKISSTYSIAGDDALSLTVPNEVSAVHLATINGLYQFSAVLDALAKGYDDPAASLSGTGNFTKAEEELGQAFSRLQTYFILKEVDNINIE